MTGVTAAEPGRGDHDHHGHDHHGHGEHGHGEHGHEHGGPQRRGLAGVLSRAWHPHQHSHDAMVDDALLASRAGLRALGISLAVLLAAGAIQAGIVAVSGSVGLLADTIHNIADALTAVPIGLSFWAARRPPTSRYTYGFGRSEDLAGLAVIVIMAVSAGTAAWQAVSRLVQPGPVHHLPWVAAAGLVGFLGNEIAARYRVGTGRRIGSAALVADGQHARVDGLTSLAVVAGAAGVGAGWHAADPVVGILVTGAILAALAGAARGIYRRLMDAVDPGLVAAIESAAAGAAKGAGGVAGCGRVRVRWIGHELYAELDLTVSPSATVGAAHELTEVVRHQLLHEIPRLTDATIHVNPQAPGDADAHARTAHHFAARR